LLPYSVLWPLAAAAPQAQPRQRRADTPRGVAKAGPAAPVRKRAAQGSSSEIAAGRSAHASGPAASVLAAADPAKLDANAEMTLFVPIRLGPLAIAEAEKRRVRIPPDRRLCLHHDPRENQTVTEKSDRVNFSICSAIQVDGNSGLPLVALASAFQPLEAIRDYTGAKSLFQDWSEASARKYGACAGACGGVGLVACAAGVAISKCYNLACCCC
jgi:hypothetical protein